MDRVVLVTGSSSGIGRETALFFASRGWRVVASMRCPEVGGRVFSGLGNVDVVRLDVLDRDSVSSAVGFAVEKFGGVDVLVNNAGYCVFGPFEATFFEQVKREFDTNVLGLMEVTRAVIPVMRGRGGGVIVNVSSVAGLVSFPFYSVYNASKWAVEGFSESLFYELKPFGIRVKVVEPGVVKTDFYSRSIVCARKEGLDVYDGFVKCVSDNVAAMVERGSSPRVVAEAIYRAALDESDRIRYPVGLNASPVFFLRRILPESVFCRFIRRAVLGGGLGCLR